MKGKDISEENKNIHDGHTKSCDKTEETLVAVPFHNVC